MIIGVPKETKTEEYRVALTPEGTKLSVEENHTVRIESNAGVGSGFSNDDYATLSAPGTNRQPLGSVEITDAKTAWAADIVVKVKEPQKSEFKYLRPNLILLTYLHLAAFPKLTEVLQKKRVTAIDYATVQLNDGTLPLLRPMSEITGRLAPQIGANLLGKPAGGRGLLLGGTTGVEPATVVIIGGGIVGTAAAHIALGMDAKVILLQHSLHKIPLQKERFKKYGDRFSCCSDSDENVEIFVPLADLLISDPLIPGAPAPIRTTEKLVKKMRPGSVIMDISIDQGGSVEGSHPTTHKNPTFVKHGVIYYCVANMPGMVPRTSTLALTKETLPYALELANKGFEKAVRENLALAKGVNVHNGKITHQKLAEALGKEYTPLANLL